jgi:hypothetical protein
MSSSRSLAVGDLYQQELLHTQATYRVIAVEGDHVTVEAIDVPGLERGHRLRLTSAGLDGMVRLAPPTIEPDPATKRRQPLPGTPHARPA